MSRHTRINHPSSSSLSSTQARVRGHSTRRSLELTRSGQPQSGAGAGETGSEEPIPQPTTTTPQAAHAPPSGGLTSLAAAGGGDGGGGGAGGGEGDGGGKLAGAGASSPGAFGLDAEMTAPAGYPSAGKARQMTPATSTSKLQTLVPQVTWHHI